jgi:hypothetical protein
VKLEGLRDTDLEVVRAVAYGEESFDCNKITGIIHRDSCDLRRYGKVIALCSLGLLDGHALRAFPANKRKNDSPVL